MTDSVTVPARLARRANRVLRPRDAAEVYAHPRAELARLARHAVLRPLATGYYAMAPLERLGDPRWRPGLAAAALGIAQADYGRGAVTLMGITAARHHGALPRAAATAVVAAPKQRPPLHTDLGDIVFVKRDVSRLDLERATTELTTGWVTTVEQTLLDLAARPGLGGLAQADVHEAIRDLASRTDWATLTELAGQQHKPGALARAREIAGHPDARP